MPPAKLQMLLEARNRQYQKIPTLTGIFSRKSLEDFAESGILEDIPADYAIPFSPDERLLLLERLYEVCSTDRQIVRAINPLNFPVSRHVSLSIHGSRELVLYIYDPAQNSYHYLSIGERTLLNAFMDFITHLPETGLVYSKEETLKMIEASVRRLRSQ